MFSMSTQSKYLIRSLATEIFHHGTYAKPNNYNNSGQEE